MRNAVIFISSLWVLVIALVVSSIQILHAPVVKKSMKPDSSKVLSHISPTPISTPTLLDLVTITSPAQNEQLCFGQSYTINWHAKGTIESATINLLHSATPSANFMITADAPFTMSEDKSISAGSYRWNIPDVLGIQAPKVGEDYQFELAVKSQNGDKFALSDYFTLAKCLPPTNQPTPASSSAIITP